MTRQHYKPGMIVRIPVSSHQDCIAQVLARPEIAVFNLFVPTGTMPSPSDIASAEVLFRIWVMAKAITTGHWPRILISPLRTEFTFGVPRFKRDPLNGQFSKYVDGVERPASPTDCLGLEPAAVWSAVHVEARLQDHLAGRKHKPLQFMMEGLPLTPQISNG